MICPYCDQEVNTRYCPHCGALQELPKQPAPIQPEIPQNTVNLQVDMHVNTLPDVPACPRCGSRETYSRRRGFRWGLAIFGFFLIPVYGLLLGFIGSRKTVQYCSRCRKKFKPTHP